MLCEKSQDRHLQPILLTLFFSLLPSVFCGCGLRYNAVKNMERFGTNKPSDLNSELFKFTRSEEDPNKILSVEKRKKTQIILEKPCRAKYSYNFLNPIRRSIIVTGQLPNGKEYPVRIDSGCCGGVEILLNDLVVKENELQIFILGPDKTLKQENSSDEIRGYGNLCCLPSLKIGEMIIRNPFCAYIPSHLEYQMFGLPIWREKILNFGISLMSQFQYILFDNVAREIEFSYKQPFKPEHAEEWSSYPFTLGKVPYGDGCGNVTVDIPIAGKVFHLVFDTGAAESFLRFDIWEQLQKRFEVAKIKESKFFSCQQGYLPCQRAVVKTMNVGKTVLENEEVLILPEGSPYFPGEAGFFGPLTFRDTVVVLDFGRKLLWVRKTNKP